MKYDIFISSKSEDYPLAQQVYNYLKEKGHKPFLASVELNRLGMAEYGKIIDETIDVCEHMVIVSSKLEYISSDYVRYEWSSFMEELKSGRKKGNIITILKSSISPSSLPLSLRNRQSFTFENYKNNIDEFFYSIASVDYDLWGISIFSISVDGKNCLAYYRGNVYVINNFLSNYRSINKLRDKVPFQEYAISLEDMEIKHIDKGGIRFASFVTPKNYGVLRKFMNASMPKDHLAPKFEKISHELSFMAFGAPEGNYIQKITLSNYCYCYFDFNEHLCEILGINKVDVIPGREIQLEHVVKEDESIPLFLLEGVTNYYKSVANKFSNNPYVLIDSFPFEIGIVCVPKFNFPNKLLYESPTLPTKIIREISLFEFDYLALRIMMFSDSKNVGGIQYAFKTKPNITPGQRTKISLIIDNNMSIKCEIGGSELYI